MSGIQLVAGLGNPGSDHEHDRHNAGFWFVDALARRHAGRFSREPKFFGEVGRVSIDGHLLWIVKPSTYMNRSGQSVCALAGFYRIPADRILVVHDELDLPPGQSKLKLGGGSAGHNGLKDITAKLGEPGFWRLRLGIGHPRTLELNQQVVDFVLHRPSSEHQRAIDDSIDCALDCMGDLVAGRMEAAMMKLHRR
jgi:PTH1 family peptidyl-tRNA hydrolase